MPTTKYQFSNHFDTEYLSQISSLLRLNNSSFKCIYSFGQNDGQFYRISTQNKRRKCIEVSFGMWICSCDIYLLCVARDFANNFIVLYDDIWNLSCGSLQHMLFMEILFMIIRHAMVMMLSCEIGFKIIKNILKSIKFDYDWEVTRNISVYNTPLHFTHQVWNKLITKCERA